MDLNFRSKNELFRDLFRESGMNMIQDINLESIDFELQKKQEAYNNLQQAKIEDDQEKGNI